MDTMVDQQTEAERGDENAAGGSAIPRCSKQRSMDGQECVKPDGHEAPCDSVHWWCPLHTQPRLGQDCLCIKCIDSALTERWRENVLLQERISGLVDEVGH